MGRKGSIVPEDFKGEAGGFVVQVKNASGLPNRDLLGESDPFVELDLLGESNLLIVDIILNLD